MRLPEPRLIVAAFVTVALVAGCGGAGFMGTRHPGQPPLVESGPLDLNPVLATLQLMADLPVLDPGRQAELFQAAKDAASLTPTTSNRLKYALLLAIPGHAGSDPVAAQRQLAELLGTPENLLPIERYLAQSQLRQVERQLILAAENGRLRDEAPREARDKIAVVNKRLAAETDENAKLRKELDEAKAKLDAISHIERSINDRSTSVTGAGAK